MTLTDYLEHMLSNDRDIHEMSAFFELTPAALLDMACGRQRPSIIIALRFECLSQGVVKASEWHNPKALPYRRLRCERCRGAGRQALRLCGACRGTGLLLRLGDHQMWEVDDRNECTMDLPAGIGNLP